MQKGFLSRKTAKIFSLCLLLCLPEGKSQSLNTEFKPQLPQDWNDAGSLAVTKAGQIVVANNVFPAANESLIRLNSDGSRDQSFQAGTNVTGNLHLTGDKIVILGTSVVRLNQDGSLDESFQSPKVPWLAGGGTIQTDGKILLAGTFNTVNDTPRSCIARIGIDGQLDETYIPSTGSHRALGTLGRAVALQKDGRAIFAGQYPFTNGFAYVARLNHDGSLDESFQVSKSLVSNPNLVVVQPDDKIILGSLISYSQYRIVRLNSDGSEDLGFQPVTVEFSSGSPYVNSIVVLPTGKILLGGKFSQVNAVAANYLAGLNADGTLDETFQSNLLNGSINQMVLKGHCELLISGEFTEFGGQAVSKLASLFLPSPEVHCHLERINGKVSLHFLGESGKTYRIETSSNLTDWIPHSEQSFEGPSFFLLLGGENRFYRAVAE